MQTLSPFARINRDGIVTIALSVDMELEVVRIITHMARRVQII